MLRELKTAHLRPFINSFAITLSGTGIPTAIVGKPDISSLVDIANGRYQVNLKAAFTRQFLQFACRREGATSNGFSGYLDVSNGATEFRIKDAAGAAEETDLNILLVGFNSLNTNKTIPQLVRSTKNKPRLILAQVQDTGEVIIGKTQITVVKSATGVYNITYRSPFASASVLPVPVACAYSSGSPALQNSITAGSNAVNGCTVKTYHVTTGAAQDSSFMFVCLGQDTRTEQGGQRKPIVTSGRLPRALFFRITGSATPALAIGGVDGTVADSGSGVGDWTITFAKPFRRAPVCINYGQDPSRSQIHTATKTFVRVFQSNAAATLLDADMNIAVFGWDSEAEQ